MSKFIGVKMVEAVPMTAGQAANKGYRTPIAEKPTDLNLEGYEVTYEDGYKSWCPADVFEAAYFKVDNEHFISDNDVTRFVVAKDVDTLGTKTTIVSVRTLSGYECHGLSSCVDPHRYNQETGAKIALEKVKNEIWAGLGFVLQWARNGLKK